MDSLALQNSTAAMVQVFVVISLMTIATKKHRGVMRTLHGVFKALINGVQVRGEGGVLFVKGDECVYCFPSDFENTVFRGQLSDTLSDAGSENFFVVEERDATFHVLAYPKARVWGELGDAVATNTTTISEETTDNSHDVAHGDESSSVHDTAPSAP